MSIGYWGTENFKVVNMACHKNGRILILDAELNYTNFLLVNFCSSNSEFEQLSTFSSLQKLLVKSDDCSKKNTVFKDDFNLIFDQKFDVSRGNLILKKEVSSETY